MTAGVTLPLTVALRIHVAGVVQGVGFRPFVHRLATRYKLAGWVRNTAGDVQIRVEGEDASVTAFVEALQREAPPLARIEAVEWLSDTLDPDERAGFRILESLHDPDRRQPVAPDVALCAACERELFDPANRRFRYPFITCTDCGPRFTVIESMPYDRMRTSMRVFPQCPACLREYEAPGDRRFHSETNSCRVCGPRVWLEGNAVPDLVKGEAALQAAARMLRDGSILAIRGLGGFHLAVDATNAGAVERLRARKHREAKPLAVMVRTIDEARHLATIEQMEEELLLSAERPVVLLSRCEVGIGEELAPGIAPCLSRLGIMLAYTPLHHLLLSLVGRPLVMTSGNASEEPIATGNDEARHRLNDIADALLLHDREIVARYDDSVVRAVDGKPVFLRRARGYAPLPLELPVASPVPMLATGPHLKNTFALVHGRRAYVSQHIGDLENLETLEHFRDALHRNADLFHVRPEAVVCDMHPGYMSTRLAEETGLPMLRVQHHHAHVAAVMAENGRTDLVVGVAYDGTGYGDDGATWGAEVMLADLTAYRRVGHLRYARMPGGDAAARSPWRVAAGYLSLEPTLAPAFQLAAAGVPEQARHLVEQQLARGINAPMASSMGRLFDAVAAVLGVRSVCAYEGQAAMELEALAGALESRPLPWNVCPSRDGCWQFDPVPLLAALGEERQRGVPVAELAAAFHESVVEATVALVRHAAALGDCRTVALGGGCFQNARLLSRLRERLVETGYDVLLPLQLSPNDGAVSFGQAAVGAALLSQAGSSTSGLMSPFVR